MATRLICYMALIAAALLLILDGRELVLENVDPRLRTWAANALGADEVSVGSIGFSLGAGEEPAGLILNDVVIAGTDTTPTMTVPKIETGFQIMQTLTGQVRPTSISVNGVSLALAREADGTVMLSSDGSHALPLIGAGGGGDMGFASLLQAADLFHEIDMLSRLTRVDLEDLDIRFADARSAVVYAAKSALAYVSRETGNVTAGFSAAFDAPGAQTPIHVQASLQSEDVSGETRIAVRFDAARPKDNADSC